MAVDLRIVIGRDDVASAVVSRRVRVALRSHDGAERCSQR